MMMTIMINIIGDEYKDYDYDDDYDQYRGDDDEDYNDDAIRFSTYLAT